MDWEKIINEENRMIDNSDRKFRHHFLSIDIMSDETVHQESIYKNYSHYIGHENKKFNLDKIYNYKLRIALKELTPKQLKAIELHYFHGYKQTEIAAIMRCSPQNVNKIITKALISIKNSISN